MAREIKFRAWDTRGKSWLYPYPEGFHLFGETTCFDLIRDQMHERYPGESSLLLMNEVELMQYTGLKDKNGKEIYEGDIVYVKQNIYAQKHLTVEWGVDRWEFKEEFDNGDYYYGYAIRWEEVEVIGNIYENSDLLDKQT